MTFIAPHETNHKAVSSSLSGTLKTSKVESYSSSRGPKRRFLVSLIDLLQLCNTSAKRGSSPCSSAACFMSRIRRPTALFYLSARLLNNRTRATPQGFSLMSSYALAPNHYLKIHNWAPDQKCGGSGKRNIPVEVFMRPRFSSNNFKLMPWEVFLCSRLTSFQSQNSKF